MKFIHQGLEGKAETIFTADGKHASRQNFGKVAAMSEIYDGEKGFTETSMSPLKEATGEELALMRLQHPVWTSMDWSKSYTDVTISGEMRIDGTRAFIVSLSGKDMAERKIFVNEDTSLVVREIMQIPIHSVGKLSVEINYSDFREVGGAMVPFKATSKNVAIGTAITQYTKAEELKSVPDGAFEVKSDE